MKTSAVIQIPAYVFFILFFFTGFTSQGTGDNLLLALAYVILGVSALLGSLSLLLSAKGL
jgi:hypothetical protein